MLESGDLAGLGSLIGEAWDSKRGISSGISSDELDAMHNRIMAMGATGAKLLGAGGGGFFLVHGDADLRVRLVELGPKHRLIPLGVDGKGSIIIDEV
jgi:D-glycero-alpha-D-manno-heptose-7-phosphate kinase